MYRDQMVSQESNDSRLASMFSAVYGWMTFALGLSGLCAFLVGTTPSLAKKVLAGPGFIVLAIIEIVLVLSISAGINKFSAAVATALFVAYAAVNGLTLSVIFVAYDIQTIAISFFVTAGTFAAMALVGTTTKTDLTKMGGIFMMALIGLIIASIVNIFWGNSMLDWIITFAGVLIFTGLTAYDAQKIKQMYLNAAGSGFEVTRKVAILGALALYLDFINLLLYMLRLFGKRK